MTNENENKVEPQSLSQPGNPEVQREQAGATKSHPGPTTPKNDEPQPGAEDVPDGH